MAAAPPDLPPLPLPTDPALHGNAAWQYYYGPGAPFARPCSKHVRMHRIAWAVHLLRGLDLDRAGGLVDVGCGPGESTMTLARTLGPFPGVMGVEISLAAAGLFRGFGDTCGVAASYVRGTCTQLPVRAASASLIASFEMVEHVANWREFVEEAARALRPGGRLMISTPNTRALHTRLKLAQRRLKGWKAPAYRHYYDFYEEFIPDGELRDAVSKAGLRLEILTHGGHVISAAPDWALGPSLAAERLLEARGALDALAVSPFVIARKP
jgi:2-polyprenyl-6-hydroxyphenyl methylase/3-demethylubiquinone-9 3-methyltransferase